MFNKAFPPCYDLWLKVNKALSSTLSLSLIRTPCEGYQCQHLTESLSQKFFRRFYLNFVVWNKNVKNVIIRDHYDNLKDFKLMLLKQKSNNMKEWKFSDYLWSINWPWKTGVVGRCLDSCRLQSKWEMKTLCFKLILLESWGLSIPMLLSFEWLKSIFYPAHVMIMNFNTLNCLS